MVMCDTFFDMRGTCPLVMGYTFQKQEENVPQSSVTLSRNGRKMSHSNVQHFIKTGGKCPQVICDIFQKQDENVH